MDSVRPHGIFYLKITHKEYEQDDTYQDYHYMVAGQYMVPHGHTGQYVECESKDCHEHEAGIDVRRARPNDILEGFVPAT